MDRYTPQEIEPKWQQRWEADGLYRTPDESERPKYYFLTMYPYPSGDLHTGHWYAEAPADTKARFMRMKGYNVLFPMGFDAFGLPAENAAVQRGIHPKKWTLSNIERMRKDMRSMGTMFDWEREAVSCEPEYYRWTEWFFKKFYEAGLAYRGEALVNWSPTLQTVLANEQVIDGKDERTGQPVIQKMLTQWFFRMTKHADELLKFDTMDWPEPVKIMQTNWIGRSEGARVTFFTEDKDAIEIYTTRPDTLWGATFMVLSPEHALVKKITTDAQRAAVEAYVDQAARETEIERTSEDREKTGVFTGAHAINPVNNERIPIWIADYVLVTYGTGAIMAVPAHDQRDFAFAKQNKLPIRAVVMPPLEWLTKTAVHENLMHLEKGGKDLDMPVTLPPRAGGLIRKVAKLTAQGVKPDQMIEHFYVEDPASFDEVFVDEGVAIHSGEFNGLATAEFKKRITAWLVERGLGSAKVNYKLRDWLFSRQRYWGEPFPLLHELDESGKPTGFVVPLEASELPLRLPDLADYQPTGRAEPPLAKATDWLYVTRNGKRYRRETNTMPQWAGSCWYY